jgi:flagellar biosynthesis protein
MTAPKTPAVENLEPLQQAVALNYEHGAFAPRIVAKGKGLLAQEIIASAKQHDVFVHESKELVSMLMNVDIDEHIPPQLYLAIAELLTWIYGLEKDLD